MKLVIALVATLAAFGAAFTAAIPSEAAAPLLSAREAQELSDAELAERVLGASAVTVLEVERPSWGEDPAKLLGAPPPLVDSAGKPLPERPWPPEGPPRLDRLVFHSKAFVTGTQFGLCGADRVTVTFDDQGAVERLSAEARYGVEGPLDVSPGTWTYENFGQLCAGVKSTQAYFPAPGPQSAMEFALFLAEIRRQAAADAPLTFVLRCTERPLCLAPKNVLKSLELTDVVSMREADCPRTDLTLPTCLEAEFQPSYGRATLRVVGSYYRNRLVIRSVEVRPSILVY